MNKSLLKWEFRKELYYNYINVFLYVWESFELYSDEIYMNSRYVCCYFKDFKDLIVFGVWNIYWG